MFTGKLIKVVKTPAYCLFSMRLTFVCIKKSKISAGFNFFLKHVLMIFFNLIFFLGNYIHRRYCTRTTRC